MARIRIVTKCQPERRGPFGKLAVIPPSIVDVYVYAVRDDGSEELLPVTAVSFKAEGSEALTATLTVENVELDVEAECADVPSRAVD
jgi:hypothetical protein